MADETMTTLANFLYDMKGPLQENFHKRHLLLDVLKRDTNTSNFDGLQVRVPQLLSLKQGTSGIAETGTFPLPQALNQAKALIPMARVGHSISITPDLMKAAAGGNFAYAGGALKLEMQQAEEAMPRVENEMMNGAGNALIAAVTATTNTTAVTIGLTPNLNQIYAGRVIDILVVSTGATVTNGSGRTIVSYTASTGVLNLDTGGGSVSVDNTYGVFIQGTYGNAIQGLQQAAAITGTFEGINKATVTQWQGVDGRAGDTTAADLSVGLLDGAERRAKVNGDGTELYIGDPAVVDKFGQTLLTQSRWPGDKSEIGTGWGGISYRNKQIIPEFDAKPGGVLGISTKSFTFYAFGNGPDWDDLDGAIFKRFNRNLTVEAWLVDWVQLGVHRCNQIVFLNNLNQAA